MLYKKKNSPYWYYDFVVDGRRFHGSTRLKSRRDAEKSEDEIRRRAILGESARPRITLDEAAGLYWRDRAHSLPSSKTTEYQLENIIKGLGGAALVPEIGMREIASYSAHRRAKVSDTSVNREIELMRRVWRYADRLGYEIGPMPKWGELLYREPPGRVRELLPDEEARLMASLSPDLAAVVAFAILSGQRRTSIITLRWSDIDLTAGRATVTIKGGKRHTFPLTPRLVALIANQPKAAAQVFTYECERQSPRREGRTPRIKGQRYPFSRQGWARQWRAALKRAGIDDFRFHDLRHTALTRLVRATGNLKIAQKLAGHTEIATTARYAHATEDDVRKAMAASESRTIPEQGDRAKREAEGE